MDELFAPLSPRRECLSETPARWTRFDTRMFRLMGWRFEDYWALRRQQKDTDGEALWWSPLRRLFVWQLRQAAARCACECEARGELPALAIVDDPIFFSPLVRALRKGGARVIGVCQNIETLSRWQVTAEGQPRLFEREIGVLSACDLVVTISREEQFLLRSFGIPAEFLRYVPPEPVRSHLLKIRAARGGERTGRVLMVGSSGNLATREGMIAAIRAWGGLRMAEELGIGLRVIGFGSEGLAAEVGEVPRGVTFLGALSEEDMARELVLAEALLCHQDDGSGVLTRVMDMLVAGVPVVASQHAARSYHHLPGIHEYVTLDGLRDALLGMRASAAVPPLPPEARVDELRERIHALAQGGGAAGA